MSAPVVHAGLVAALLRLERVAAVFEGTVVLVGDVLERLRELPDASVQCIVTSPPYLDARDYGVAPTAWPEVTYQPRFDLPEVTVAASVGCLGHEKTLVAYVGHLVLVWRELARVLRRDGVCWLNLGAGYSAGTTAPRKPSATKGKRKPAVWATRCHEGRVSAGLAAKQLIPVPSAVRDALQAEGWWVRNEVVWAKPGATPSSVFDRCTPAHEALFLLTRAPRYRSHFERLATPAVATASRNKARKHGDDRRDPGDHSGTSIPWRGDTAHPRDVWVIPSERLKEKHTATFPAELARRCVLAGSDPGEVVFDPFAGTGTTLGAAVALGRAAVGVEAQADFIAMMPERISRLRARILAPPRRRRKARRASGGVLPKLDAISPLTPAVTNHGPLFESTHGATP